MMRIISLLFCVLCSLFSPLQASEADDSMRKVRSDWEAANEEAVVRATTFDRNGRAGLQQEFHLWQAWKSNGQDLARIKFTAPAHFDGIQLLTEGERQWLRSPPFKPRSVRFDKGQGGDEFAQTVFTHEDLRSIDLQNYRYRSSGAILVAEPLKAAESAYSRLEIVVDHTKSVIAEIRYFNKNGEHVKTQTNGKWLEAKPGVWRPQTITMTDLKTGRRTEVSITYLGFKRLEPRIFSPAELGK